MRHSCSVKCNERDEVKCSSALEAPSLFDSQSFETSELDLQALLIKALLAYISSK